MAQSGYTPISFYYSSTAAATPSAGNLVNGEIAINTADGVIYYKNTGGTVVPLSFGSAAVSWQSVQASSFTAAAGKGYPVNTTSAGITATLPASPTAGQAVGFVDYAGTFATNKLTINPNGGKILGATGNVVVGTNRESLLFVYIDSTKGWLPYAGFLGSNPAPAAYTASYLVVAGGGAGGSNRAGGGGAGGLLANSVTFTGGTVYTVTVGSGGTGSTGVTPGVQGGNGSNSSISGTGLTTVTAVGGGGGGTYDGSPESQNSGLSGGSGGGCSREQNTGTAVPGSGTSGQGYAGGDVVAYNNGNAGGGGGGASAVGTDGVNNGPLGVGPYAAGNGGNGVSSTITGSAVTYAGGGGGGVGSASPSTFGSGGTGGGGAGTYNGSGTAGTVNTGGGGGGGGASPCTGGNGGSGVVILSVPTANYSGTTTGSPTVTTSGSNTVIKFTASGSYTA